MSFIAARGSSTSCPNVVIGQSSRGDWIVQDGDGRHGGIFRHRRDALRFAFADCRAASIFMMPEPIELSFGVPVMTPASRAPAGGPESAMALTGPQTPWGKKPASATRGSILMSADPAMPILIVDDYQTMVRIIRNLLKQIGFENVDEASSGEEALARLREKRTASSFPTGT